MLTIPLKPFLHFKCKKQKFDNGVVGRTLGKDYQVLLCPVAIQIRFLCWIEEAEVISFSFKNVITHQQHHITCQSHFVHCYIIMLVMQQDCDDFKGFTLVSL